MSHHVLEDEIPMVADGDAEMHEEAAPVTIGKITLEMFTGRRKAAASAMGMKFIRFTPEDWRKFLEEQSYDGVETDVAIFCYLCAHPHSVSMRAATRTGKEETEKALEWAEKHEVFFGERYFGEAREAFWTAMLAIATNSAKQELAPEDDADPLKKKLPLT